VLEPLENPFGPKVLPMLGTLCNPCVRAGPSRGKSVAKPIPGPGAISPNQETPGPTQHQEAKLQVFGFARTLRRRRIRWAMHSLLFLLLVTPALTWAQGGLPASMIQITGSQGRPLR
jgi:hypothetical protein